MSDEDENSQGLDVVGMYELLVQKRVSTSPNEEQERLQELTAKVLNVPVLMRDPEDLSYIGAPPERVEDFLKFHRLEMVNKELAVLVLEDLYDIKREQ